MNQSEQGTKAKITDEALDLFSVNGFETVSIRDIGKAVGIKESSIYYHFKNKEDILQTILHEAEQGMQKKKDGFNEALSVAAQVTCESFIMAGIAYVEGFLLEERMYKFIRMLTIEKQRNAEAADIYKKLLFTEPLEHHGRVFSYLKDKQYIRNDNPEELAAEYQAVILFVYQKYFTAPPDSLQEAKTLAYKELAALLKRFYSRYFHDEELIEQ
jgi:AcrR family transcriptional regulator